jgi:g-D-glutamyl-meso-diaminopimelate peptidase
MKNPSGSAVKVDNSLATTTNSQATTTPVKAEGSEIVIGKSVDGKDIVAYNYGNGEKRILLIGGVHGGYSWNTALVAYEMMDYLKANPNVIPKNIKVTVIPVLNPDGLNEAVGTSSKFSKSSVSTSNAALIASRFNSNNVDLSRNFDCDWKATGVWQTKPVSGGSKPFSEPEAMAIKNYVESHSISAVVVWYSSAGGVYASSCGGDVSGETIAITDAYAKASGYPAYDSYDFYATTGDLVNWLAKKNIPAISVLLTTHKDTELAKNKSGLGALLQHYSK